MQAYAECAMNSPPLFFTKPVFAWLNYCLVKQDKKHKLSPTMNVLAIVGLIYLVGFAVLFVLNFAGILA